MAHHSERPPAHDKAPAFIGLVLGAIVIAAILFGMVKWTNARFDAHRPAAGAPAQH